MTDGERTTDQSSETTAAGGVRPPRGSVAPDPPRAEAEADASPDETRRRVIGARSRMTAHPAVGAPIRPPMPHPILPEIHSGIRLRGAQGFGG